MYGWSEKIVIPFPKEDACEMCGELHSRDQPHNLNSIVYQHRFRKRHGRYPTWEDAFAGCTESAKKRFRKIVK